MKNKIVKILLLSTIFITIVCQNNEFAESEILLGDLNNDYVVNMKDMRLILKHISSSNNNQSIDKILTDIQLESADINRDGNVNVEDAGAMFSYLTTKNNPYNIGTKYQLGSNNNDNSIDQTNINISSEPIDLSEAIEKNTIINQNTGKENIEFNAMQLKLASSDKIRFEKDLVKIKTNEVEKLKVVSDNSSEPIKITTSDSNIVELYGVGIAVGKNPGEAIITAEQGNEKTQCKVTVIDRNEEVFNIEINKEEINLETGETTKLEAKTEPVNKEIKWATSNSQIVEVEDDGTIISKKAGIAGVYAISGSQKAICVVIVKDKEIDIQEVAIDKSELEITQGESGKIKIGIAPENATLREIELTSENDNIKLKDTKVQVDEKGFAEIDVLASKPGTTTLTAKAGEKEAKTTIIVKEASVEKITLDTNEIKMEENQLRRITATIEPEIVNSKKIKWTSDNEAVAKVDENGLVTSVKPGEATITATVDDKSTTCKVIVEKTKVSVRGIMIQQSLTIKEDQELKIPIELQPANATNRDIEVKLDNANAVIGSEKITVGENGKAEIKITGKKIGKSVLTVSSGAVVEKCNINVIPKVIPVSKITLSSKEITMDKGQSRKITIKIEPSNATNKEITIKLSNSNASVDKTKVVAGNDGIAEITISGKKEGKTKITAIAGDKTAICNVKVNAIVEYISLSEKEIILEGGKTKKISATITPSSAVNKNITWSSSNSSVATVDGNGTIKGIGDGTAVITASAGTASASCTVKVNATKVTLDRTILMIDNIHYNIADLEAKLSSTAIYNGKDVTWKIENSSIAKFKSGGKKTSSVKGGTAQIVGLKFGTTKITATLPNNKKATCKLKVITSSKEKASGDRFVNWQHGSKWFPFYLRKGNWGKEYVEAYINNAAKLVKKHPSMFSNGEAGKRDIWCYRQKSLKFNYDKKKKIVNGYSGNDYGEVTPQGHGDFEEIKKVKKKGELSPNNYILLFTSKNQWAYVLNKNSKTGKWEVIASRESAAGYNRDTFEGYLCIMKKESYLGPVVTYERWNRGASSYQNAVHVDCGSIQGEPQSAGCIRVGYTKDHIYYRVFVEAGVGTRVILF